MSKISFVNILLYILKGKLSHFVSKRVLKIFIMAVEGVIHNIYFIDGVTRDEFRDDE